jgi:hypothetical protein
MNTATAKEASVRDPQVRQQDRVLVKSIRSAEPPANSARNTVAESMTSEGANVEVKPFNPALLLSQPPDLLYESCEKLAHALLDGDGPAESDPFSRMAESILSAMLMDWVLHSAEAKRGNTK